MSDLADFPTIEAAERARPAAIAALPPAPPPRCELSDPGVTVPGAQEGVAQNPLQPEPVSESAGDLAAVCVAGDEGDAPPVDSPAPGVIVEDDAPLETSEAEARPYIAPITVADSGFTITASATIASAQHAEFVALVMTAFDCKFPSHPKPSQEWWANVRAAGLALQGLK